MTGNLTRHPDIDHLRIETSLPHFRLKTPAMMAERVSTDGGTDTSDGWELVKLVNRELKSTKVCLEATRLVSGNTHLESISHMLSDSKENQRLQQVIEDLRSNPGVSMHRASTTKLESTTLACSSGICKVGFRP